ncbi:glycosyltransferase [Phenylobacterium sp. J426]|uniref:glycosyltransferase n=1 Tax=Phenylobacterium sp. J426 TaxID=2898439 RepID=UPI002151B1CA|nr:glycosyltransferase [Phenylobacterium sp. J426]MCR5872940.1 glycosyltransferase [Phenylobacterium sp. J426]
MSEATALRLAEKVRPATLAGAAAAVEGNLGFHLLDTTMMYAPKSGGVKRYLMAKRAWLEKRRPDIRHSLVVPGARTHAEADGIVTVAAARLPFGNGYRMPASLAKWETVLTLLRPDIIEAGDVFVPGHAALEAGEAMGVPVVGFCHTDAAALAALHFGEWAEQPTFNFWAQAYQRFDHVVAPSKHMAARLADAGVERLSIQQLGVDTELFDPVRGDRAKLLRRLGLSAETRLLVFAGRPAREKNIDSMVEAVERLGGPYKLLLVGAGKDVTPSDSVICLDYERDPVKLAGIIASCDACLHANENEIFGLVVLEAMAAGLPVVGSKRGGVGELIDETVGQPAETVDAKGLAAAIEALFARDLAEISRAARRRAEARHGWDATFEALTRLYGGLVQGRARPPLALTA